MFLVLSVLFHFSTVSWNPNFKFDICCFDSRLGKTFESKTTDIQCLGKKIWRQIDSYPAPRNDSRGILRVTQCQEKKSRTNLTAIQCLEKNISRDFEIYPMPKKNFRSNLTTLQCAEKNFRSIFRVSQCQEKNLKAFWQLSKAQKKF